MLLLWNYSHKMVTIRRFGGLPDFRYYTKEELASTVAPSGSSLIGVEDAGGYFVGTDVEAVLQELMTTILPGAYLRLDGTNIPTANYNWTTNLTTTGNLQGVTVTGTTSVVANTMTLATGSITDTTGAISFGDEDIITTGIGNIGTLTVNSAFTFPVADGLVNQVLVTNGADVLTWIGGAGTGSIGFWNRTGTVLSPVNAGDDITTTGTITSGDITIFDATPILVFQDSNSLGAASVGFIEWRDSGGGRAGFFGNNSSGNDDLYWKNEQGGNIGIETTGAGEVQIFSNVDITGTINTTSDDNWDLNDYTAGVQTDTGYVTVTINGTAYKLLARLEP